MALKRFLGEWRYRTKISGEQVSVLYHYYDLPMPRKTRYKGKPYYCDPVSQKLRPTTPEEAVRQRILFFLHYDMQIPYEAMEIEVPLSRFWKRATGRMDIVVYPSESDHRRPLLVVECKAAHIPLKQQVYTQADNYAVSVGIPFVAVTNGGSFFMDHWDACTHTYDRLPKLPVYASLCELPPDQASGNVAQGETIFEHDMGKKYRVALRDGVIGAQTPQLVVPFLLNLYSCWMDEERFCTEYEGLRLLEDCGVCRSPVHRRNGASHSYRHLRIEDLQGKPLSVRIRMYAPQRRGVKEGPTYLAVALGEDQSSPALQLKVEDFVSLNCEHVRLWHDGSLTIGGAYGSALRSEMLDYVKERAPHLIGKDGMVVLGTLENDHAFTIEEPAMQTCLRNMIQYALLRDGLRAWKKHDRSYNKD